MLVGASRLGKTVWARSLGRHIYWNSYFNVADWDNEASYLVADDIPWDNFKRIHKALLGCQREFVLTDKYVKKLKIQNWGKPTIFCCNEENDPFVTPGDISTLNWLRENCVKVVITNKIY